MGVWDGGWIVWGPREIQKDDNGWAEGLMYKDSNRRLQPLTKWVAGRIGWGKCN